jgi:hypothetical protein
MASWQMRDADGIVAGARGRWALALACGAGFVLTARAAEAYRPFDSTDADVAAHGEFELELGPVGYLRKPPANLLVAPATVANLGIFERWELVLQGSEFIAVGPTPVTPRGQFGETGVFLKTVLHEGSLQERSGPSVATEFGALLPAVNGEQGVGGSVAALVSQRWDFGTFHLNVGGAKTRAGDPELFVGLIAEGPWVWRVRPVAELLYDRDFGAEETVSALGGLIARVSEELSFDAAARAIRVDGTYGFEVRAGLTWAFPVWSVAHD